MVRCHAIYGDACRLALPHLTNKIIDLFQRICILYYTITKTNVTSSDNIIFRDKDFAQYSSPNPPCHPQSGSVPIPRKNPADDPQHRFQHAHLNLSSFPNNETYSHTSISFSGPISQKRCLWTLRTSPCIHMIRTCFCPSPSPCHNDLGISHLTEISDYSLHA